MNDDLSWDPAALDEFIQCLQEFRQACGRPSLRELSRLSRMVVGEYRDERYRDLPELSLAALSDVLSHRRQGPPNIKWVASFVLTCQRYAAESRLSPHDPGESTLPEWNRRLQAVYRSNGKPPAADGDGPMPLAAPVPDGQDHDTRRAGADPAPRPSAPPSPSSPPSPPTTKTTAARNRSDDQAGEPGTPSLSELRLFGLYGQYGVKLFKAAEDERDPDACYRLGLLLCTDDRPTESLVWLMRAETSGHPTACELIDTVTPRRVALTHAYRLGVEATMRGEAEVADMFLQRVVGHGYIGGHHHAATAFELGALWMERQDTARAVDWFTRAAERGHPLARWWAERIHRDAAAKGLRLPTPPRRSSIARSVSVPTLTELIEQIANEPDHAGTTAWTNARHARTSAHRARHIRHDPS